MIGTAGLEVARQGAHFALPTSLVRSKIILPFTDSPMSTRTIRLPEDVYQGLATVAHGDISKYLARLIRGNSHMGLDEAYQRMAAAEAAEPDEFEEWREELLSDVGNEAW